jgi:hypothetical protein
LSQTGAFLLALLLFLVKDLYSLALIDFAPLQFLLVRPFVRQNLHTSVAAPDWLVVGGGLSGCLGPVVLALLLSQSLALN